MLKNILINYVTVHNLFCLEKHIKNITTLGFPCTCILYKSISPIRRLISFFNNVGFQFSTSL